MATSEQQPIAREPEALEGMPEQHEQQFRTIAVRVQESLHTQLSFIAQLAGSTLSEEIREAIEKRIATAQDDPELIKKAQAAERRSSAKPRHELTPLPDLWATPQCAAQQPDAAPRQPTSKKEDKTVPTSTKQAATSPIGSVKALIYLRVSTARQATKNGEAEGYSIPAQREACYRRARELGAEVIEEFIDAGASARSADRAHLQRLLERVKEGDISYVIVHKLDRLARSRIDDAQITLAFQLAGTTLVSTSEQIDDSPSGTLLHGIIATIAEH